MLLLIFYFLVAAHLLELILLFLPVIKHQNHDSTDRPSISVIVAARNEYTNLIALIPLLLKQNYGDFEIIIALDRCDDESKNFMRDQATMHSKIKLIVIDELPDGYNGKKYALTQAIEAAKNEWLLFTDADCRPSSSRWIECFAENIRSDSSILLGISPYEGQHTLLNQFIQYETLLTALKYVSSAIVRRPYMGVGRNLAYKKSLFTSGGGFSPFEGVSGGDDDLFVQKHANRKNTHVVTGTQSLTYSDPKDHLNSYLDQKTRHLSIGKYYKKKFIHLYSTILHAMLWLCFLYLVFIHPLNPGVILTFILLIISKGLIFNLSSRKMGFNYNPLFLPISDLIYGVLYPFVGLRALLFRKVKWK